MVQKRIPVAGHGSAIAQFKRAVRHQTAGAVVFRGDEVLILQKSNGQWVFPKGHVESGEHREQTAQREVLEEAGVNVRVGSLVGTMTYTFLRPDGQAEHRKRVDWYLGTWLRGEPRPEPEIFRRACFVLPEEAVALLMLEEDRQILAKSVELLPAHRAEQAGH